MGDVPSLSIPQIHLAALPRKMSRDGMGKTDVLIQKGSNPAYAWEPVIVYGGRKVQTTSATVRDWLACSMAMEKGLRGAKPTTFAFWIFRVLGLQLDDEFKDLFPGSGQIDRAYRQWRGQLELQLG